jgi:hypothetical protein
VAAWTVEQTVDTCSTFSVLFDSHNTLRSLYTILTHQTVDVRYDGLSRWEHGEATYVISKLSRDENATNLLLHFKRRRMHLSIWIGYRYEEGQYEYECNC